MDEEVVMPRESQMHQESEMHQEVIIQKENITGSLFPKEKMHQENMLGSLLPKTKMHQENMPGSLLPKEKMHQENRLGSLLPKEKMHQENMPGSLLPKQKMHQQNMPGSLLPKEKMHQQMLKSHLQDITMPNPSCTVKLRGMHEQDKPVPTAPREMNHYPQEMVDNVKPPEDAVSKAWVFQIDKRFKSGEYKSRQPSSDVSIYRVPATIRDPKLKAYVPLISSFGPYHHHKKDQPLSAMDDYKLEAVHRILNRFHSEDIDYLIGEVGKLEKSIQSCYEDLAIEYTGKSLAWMFTMDACFILEFFLTLHTEQHEEEHINFFFRHNGLQNIYRWEIIWDILKLENQIPLFVLISILKLGVKDEKTAVSILVELLVPFKQFKGFPFSLSVSDDSHKLKLKEHIQGGASHLLDLSRRMINDFLIDSSSLHASPSTGSAKLGFTASANIGSAKCTFSCSSHHLTLSDDDSIPSAKKLNEAGIKFKPAPQGNIRFEGRCFGSSFFIPQITIDDDTEILLRNLIAFEECQGCRLSPEPTIISTYMRLLDDLIDTPEDVGLLKKDKVIKSLVGSDKEVAAMINDLCKGITYVPNPQYKEAVQELREHYDSHLKVWISQFFEEKCSKPWHIISLVVATLLLGMTAVQTYFTVKN